MPPEDVNEVVEKAFKDKFQVPETSLTKKGGNTFLGPIFQFKYRKLKANKQRKKS